MNFYLLFAIAFGAIAPAVEAPILRRPMAGVASRREARALTRRFAAPSPATRERVGVRVRRVVARVLVRIEAPLTGAATPRAPATV